MRPNILFVFADDWGRYASAYAALEGDRSLSQLIHTPHFDRVAAEGVLFTNALVPAPSCTPCRSSVLSGRYFWQCGLGAILQGAVWDESIPSYPLLLEQAGYHIGHTYKVWSPGKTKNAPYGGERTAYNPAGYRFGGFSHQATADAPDIGVEAAKQRLLDETSANFEAFLEARPDAETPWCYWWGPTNTHRTWERGSGKALWGIDPDALEGRLPAFLPDVPAVREDVADYLGECQAVDRGLGALMARIEALGELDDTLIVVSGDHGIPGFPRAKCNLYDIGCEVALGVRWPARVPGGRVVDDFVNLMDLAPTFLEAAGETPPAGMTARSLLPLLTSTRAGRVEPERDHVVIGRERHVAIARDGQLPYPQRAIRTADYLYIVNFAPERWPMGDPCGMDDLQAEPPPYDVLVRDTMVCYADLDASPTKAYLMHHRAEPQLQRIMDLGFGKRPMYELYDLGRDPHYLHNVAAEPAYADIRAALHARLHATLRAQDDPRIAEVPCRFEHTPYAGPIPVENQ